MGTQIFRFLAVVAAFCLFLPAAALAQAQPAVPAWDLSITAGSFSGRAADETGPGYHDDWHHAPEWRVTAGRYWTSRLKTEVEFGQTGEGDRYMQRVFTVPGSTTTYPYGAQEFVRVRQGSARVAWQFLDNQWAHPYLFLGVSVDEERKRAHVFQQTYLPDPRNTTIRRVGVPEHDEGPVTTYRPGVVMGGGAKWYVSPKVFLKTGGQLGFTRATKSVTFTAGMGFDF